MFGNTHTPPPPTTRTKPESAITMTGFDQHILLKTIALIRNFYEFLMLGQPLLLPFDNILVKIFDNLLKLVFIGFFFTINAFVNDDYKDDDDRHHHHHYHHQSLDSFNHIEFCIFKKIFDRFKHLTVDNSLNERVFSFDFKAL